MTVFTWTGWDGSEWNFNDGPVYLRPGVQGLSMLESDQYVGASPSLHGQRFTGWRGRPRGVFLPVTIQPDTDWLNVARRFWATLRPDEYSTLAVVAEDGQRRFLNLRFVDDSGMSYDLDPSLLEREVAGLNLVADDPWWKSETVTRSFQQAGSASPFYSSTGASSVLTLSSGFTLDVATMTNPGDVGAWPTWTIIGPVTGFSIGYGFSLISASMTLAAGEYLVIDTDPRNQVVRKYPQNTLVPFNQFQTIDFAEIPPGESVRLSLSITGTGSVDVSFQPRFYRAF